MKIVGYEDIDSIVDWNNLEYFEYGEDHFHGMVEGAKLAGNPFKLLTQVEDFFGWDFLYELPDGRFVLTDRNGGEPTIIPAETAKKIMELAVEEK